MATPGKKEDITMDDLEGLFSDENEVKQEYINWGKRGIGATVSGFYVDKRVVPNKMKPGTDQALYTIVQKNGVPVIVAGRYGTPVATFPTMEQTPLGAFVGFKYDSDRPSTKAGFDPLKIIRVFAKRDKDGKILLHPEEISKFKGETFEEAAPEHF